MLELLSCILPWPASEPSQRLGTREAARIGGQPSICLWTASRKHGPYGARQYITGHPDEPTALHLQLRMAVDFAEGVESIQEKGIAWCDLSVRNGLSSSTILGSLGDFGGVFETLLRGREWSEVPPLTHELYALGLAFTNSQSGKCHTAACPRR